MNLTVFDAVITLLLLKIILYNFVCLPKSSFTTIKKKIQKCKPYFYYIYHVANKYNNDFYYEVEMYPANLIAFYENAWGWKWSVKKIHLK